MTGCFDATEVDLFAGGAAGWEIAARRLDLDPVGVETDEDSCATRDAAGLRTIRGDVADVTPWLGIRGLIGSPPCQAWSRAGKRLGLEDQPLVLAAIDGLEEAVEHAETYTFLNGLRVQCADQRSLLVVEPLRWALIASPEWIALEQVPDVLTVWERIRHVLAGRGYHVWTGVLNAANYGVPQTRERAILIASRVRRVGPPPPSHSDQRKGGCLLGLAPWVTMAEALGWDGPLRATQRNSSTGEYGERDSEEPAFTVASNADRWKRPARTVCGNWAPRWAYDRRQGRTRDGVRTMVELVDMHEPAPTLGADGLAKGRDVWRYRNGNQENAAERDLDEPAPTVHFGNNLNRVEWVKRRPATTVAATPRIGRPGHKNRETGEAQFERDAVPVTATEAAILQDLPPDWPFQGTKTSVFRQIGNAIPPGLAEAVLREATGIAASEAAA